MPNQKNTSDIEKKLARLAAFTELNPRPVIEIDYHGNILETNLSARRKFPDLEKKGIRHPYLFDFKNIVLFLKKHKEPFTREVQVDDRWYRQVFYYVPNFDLVHVYGSNITDRKQAEDNLRESEKRYHMLFEKMNYGYALQDIIFDKNKKPVDYRFVDVNPAFEKLSMMKKEFIIGKTVNEITPKTQTKESIKNRKQYDNVAISGQPTYFESYNEKSKKYFELYAYRPNQNQVALIFSDITGRKKTDEEKNNFIAIMSHELRNPLTPIMANAQFISLMLKKQGKAHPAIKQSLDIIEKQAKIMADLLNDILDVSRLSRQKIQLKKSRINICEVIKNSVKTSMPFITTKRQELSVFFSQKAIYTSADPLRLEQIMVNIINNASKYTQPKGHIEVHCALKEGKIEIRVKDNGMGMSPEKIKRIFELFSDNSQPFMGIGGLGIGLNIVKNLVSMHEGSIFVHSEGKNRGSEFIIKLPINNKSTAAKPLPAKKEGSPAAKSKSKILVVDDNEDIRSTVSKILQLEGHQVKSTHSGLRAVSVSKTFQPHTALIDIGLPDISGYKVAQLLRKQHENAAVKLKLVALTGYGQEKDKLLAQKAGFDHHLTKPVDINELIRLIA